MTKNLQFGGFALAADAALARKSFSSAADVLLAKTGRCR
jgi:hypothetical protein